MLRQEDLCLVDLMLNSCRTPCPAEMSVLNTLRGALLPHLVLQSKRLGAGVIDGRGAWADQGQALSLLCALRDRLGADQRIAVQARAAHFCAASGTHCCVKVPGMCIHAAPGWLRCARCAVSATGL